MILMRTQRVRTHWNSSKSLLCIKAALGLLLLILTHTAITPASYAADVSGTVEVEWRRFNNSDLVGSRQQSYLSLGAELDFYHESSSGQDSFSVKAFSRYDDADSNRSSVDLREFLWTHVYGNFESRIGVNKVFWGVTESQHLIDIINQTDLVERIDGEEKLGQPMINFSWDSRYGVFDIFVLPRFRERTFAGVNGRFSLANALGLQSSNIQTTYESSAGRSHVDTAVRWAHSFGSADIALSHFRGTYRTPVISVNQGASQLSAYYAQIDQTSLEYQQNYQDWIFKFEGVYRNSLAEDSIAVVFGAEYTFYGVAQSSVDLGVLFELNYDERGSSQTLFQNDSFVGTRLALNDTASTTILAGALIDNELTTSVWSIEANTRINDRFKFFLEARIFNSVPPTDGTVFAFRNDDYVEAKLEFFF